MRETKIPIQNLYFMLCYAWDTLPDKGTIDLGSASYGDSSEFFAQILSIAFSELKRRGLHRDYTEATEEGRTLRGKVNFAPTIKRMLMQNGMISCTYDLMNFDTKPNQILKWAFRTLQRSPDLKKESRELVHDNLHALRSVSNIEVTRRDFSTLRIHAGNKLYRFPLALCELLFELCVPDDSRTGEFSVQSLLKEAKLMASLFEAFVRNFLKREQSEFLSVGVEWMDWDASGDDEALTFLPKMKTDITLTSPNRITIIDTKFYAKIFDDSRGTEKIKASNLYQLLSYLRTKSKTSNSPVAGILLYPENGRSVKLDYVIEGHSVTVSSVNLAAPWEEVRTQVLSVLKSKAAPD